MQRNQAIKAVEARAQELTGRIWALDHVGNWLENGRERCLLITGEPGSGKTALSAWFAGAGPAPTDNESSGRLQRIRESWRVVHFCIAEDRRGSLDPARFAHTVALQLSQRYGEFAEAVLKRIEPKINIRVEARENWGTMVGAHIEHFIVNTRPEDAFNRIVRDPLEELAERQPTEHVYILVDALDEALTYDGITILDLLAGSMDFPETVRFVLTSRNEPRVIARFAQANRLNLSAPEHTEDMNSDIYDYVTWRMAQEPLRLHLQSTSAPDAVRDSIVTQAGGNFLYARFVLDEAAIGKRPLTNITGLPPGLYGLYREYLDRLIPDMRQYGSSQRWLQLFQPLLGCLSVATPAAPLESLPLWLDQDSGEVLARLYDVFQLTEEHVEADERGYRLYHRSMAEFLGTGELRDNGASTLNRYYTPPRTQHERLIHHYLPKAQDAWQSCDAYGLRHLVGHLQTNLELLQSPADRRRVAVDLYAVVLDQSFQAAQREVLGDAHASLADLRTTLDIALKRDDLVQALACVGAYRTTLRGARLTDSIFQSIDRREHGRALQRAEHYGRETDWARVLHLYLAWEAAEAADLVTAVRSVTLATQLPVVQAADLCDALLVRTARALAERGGQQPHAVLASWGRAHDADDLLSRYGPATPLDSAERARILADVGQQINAMEREYLDVSDEWASAVPFLDAEEVAYQAHSLRYQLAALAADPGGRQEINRALDLFVANPYPRYRDIALVALGIASVAIPEPALARERMRSIIRTALDHEGVTFTFDLPCMLLSEAERRGLDESDLGEYLDRASDQHDSWGTQARLASGRAAAHFRQGRQPEAINQLRVAAGLLDGYAGYATIAALSLASRWRELGFGWNPEAAQLCDTAAARAEQVRDLEFRDDRRALVRAYRQWSQQDVTNATLRLHELATLVDHDARTACIDYLSACWASVTETSNWEGLKALVPLSLTDATRLDTILGRLLGVRLRTLSDADLSAAIRTCAEHLTQGRPWDAGPAVRSFV